MIAIYIVLALLPLCTAALSARFFVSIHAVTPDFLLFCFIRSWVTCRSERMWLESYPTRELTILVICVWLRPSFLL